MAQGNLRRLAFWASAAAGACLIAALAIQPVHDWWKNRAAMQDLQRRLDGIVKLPVAAGQPCAWQRLDQAVARPLVLLVLGQSNAGNHGAEAEHAAPPRPPSVTFTDGIHCWRAADPIPGGTGVGQSIWSRLESALRAEGVEREVVVTLLAVDSTSISDWTKAGSPLLQRFHTLLPKVAAIPVDLVLWQQGESDARAGTEPAAYAAGWQGLVRHIRQAGIGAPVVAALSTRCRNPSGDSVRQAIRHVASVEPDVHVGPDTDVLAGPYREHDCHFTAAGLEQAAALWARALAPLLL